MTEHPNMDGLWLTISELAERKGLGKSAVSERVARLEAAGALTTRPGAGRAKLVNLAEFDRAVGQVGDQARMQGALTRRMAVSAAAEAPPAAASLDPVYAREQARNMAYTADLKKLELEERSGRLVDVSRLDEEMRIAISEVVRVMEGFPRKADEIAEAVAKDGVAGARRVLKKAVFEFRNAMADAAQSLISNFSFDRSDIEIHDHQVD